LENADGVRGRGIDAGKVIFGGAIEATGTAVGGMIDVPGGNI
jgi:hypothetical protein